MTTFHALSHSFFLRGQKKRHKEIAVETTPHELNKFVASLKPSNSDVKSKGNRKEIVIPSHMIPLLKERHRMIGTALDLKEAAHKLQRDRDALEKRISQECPHDKKDRTELRVMVRRDPFLYECVGKCLTCDICGQHIHESDLAKES